jgi:Polyketide cyclase / dehydrase and lipid transport
MGKKISCTIVRSVEADVVRIFDEVVAEDVLPKVLLPFVLLPGVVATRDHTGPWNVVGSRREISLSDGSTAREEVTEWIRPARFAYRVDRFTSPLGRLVTHATGEWGFWPQTHGSGFAWTYTFHARHPLAIPALQVFTTSLWRGYMRRCADRCADLAERPDI